MKSFRTKHNVIGGSKKFSLGVPTSPSKNSSIYTWIVAPQPEGHEMSTKTAHVRRTHDKPRIGRGGKWNKLLLGRVFGINEVRWAKIQVVYGPPEQPLGATSAQYLVV